MKWLHHHMQYNNGIKSDTEWFVFRYRVQKLFLSHSIEDFESEVERLAPQYSHIPRLQDSLSRSRIEPEMLGCHTHAIAEMIRLVEYANLVSTTVYSDQKNRDQRYSECNLETCNPACINISHHNVINSMSLLVHIRHEVPSLLYPWSKLHKHRISFEF